MVAIQVTTPKCTHCKKEYKGWPHNNLEICKKHMILNICPSCIEEKMGDMIKVSLLSFFILL